jgi:glycine cleavage system H protein
MPKIYKYWISAELYYTIEHTWARIQENGDSRVGIDDFASKTAGKILVLKLVDVGTDVEHMKPLGQIETLKWIGDIYSPFTGKIISVNQKVLEEPELVDQDPYGLGWLVDIRPTKMNEEIPRLLHGEKAMEWFKKEIESDKT